MSQSSSDFRSSQGAVLPNSNEPDGLRGNGPAGTGALPDQGMGEDSRVNPDIESNPDITVHSPDVGGAGISNGNEPLGTGVLPDSGMGNDSMTSPDEQSDPSATGGPSPYDSSGKVGVDRWPGGGPSGTGSLPEPGADEDGFLYSPDMGSIPHGGSLGAIDQGTEVDPGGM